MLSTEQTSQKKPMPVMLWEDENISFFAQYLPNGETVYAYSLWSEPAPRKLKPIYKITAEGK